MWTMTVGQASYVSAAWYDGEIQPYDALINQPATPQTLPPARLWDGRSWPVDFHR